MAERILSPRTYVGVFAGLIGLTCLTVIVSFLPLALVWHDVIGVSIGVCKATFVILFFMHALGSTRLTWSVILVAGFWLGILLVLILADYFSRGMVPHMPGH